MGIEDISWSDRCLTRISVFDSIVIIFRFPSFILISCRQFQISLHLSWKSVSDGQTLTRKDLVLFDGYHSRGNYYSCKYELFQKTISVSYYFLQKIWSRRICIFSCSSSLSSHPFHIRPDICHQQHIRSLKGSASVTTSMCSLLCGRKREGCYISDGSGKDFCCPLYGFQEY